jgi:peroxiredoxin
MISLSLLSAHAIFAMAAIRPFERRWMNHEDTNAVYRSADHPKGVFVIESYFNNCGYCHQNAPQVDALAEKFATEPRVQVLDLGIDRKNSDYEVWIEAHHPNHPVLHDGDRLVTSQLGTTGYPSTYVVDCRGTVALETVGVWSSDVRARIEQTVRSLLAQDCQ